MSRQSFVAVFARQGSGHRKRWQLEFIRRLLAQGQSVVSIFPESFEIKDEDIHNKYASAPRLIQVPPLPIRQRPLIRSLGQLNLCIQFFERWRAAKTRIETLRKKYKMDLRHIFFPELTIYDALPLRSLALRRFFPFSWSGLFIWAAPEDFQRVQGKSWSGRLWLPGECRNLYTLVESDCTTLNQMFSIPVRSFPDFTNPELPATPPREVEQLKRLAKGRQVVILPGIQSKRKGLLCLLKLVEMMDKDRFFFVFAGEPRFKEGSEEDQYIRRRNWDNCLFFFQWFEDERVLNSLINASHIIYAAYPPLPYSSNTLAKAAVFRKPIIVGPGGVVAMRVMQHKLGAVVCPYDYQAVARAIETLLRAADPSYNARFDSYGRLHSADQLDQLFSEMLQDPSVNGS